LVSENCEGLVKGDGHLKKTSRGEIDALVSVAKKMTPDEMIEYIQNRFRNDLKVFNRLVKEHRERHDWARTKPEISPLLEKVKDFYADLVSDGYIKKDFSLFKYDKTKYWKTSQSRAEYVGILEELDSSSGEDYAKTFRKWNRAYVINYESIVREYLVEPAQKISGRRVSDKTRVIEILQEYKNGKHSDLFRSLVPLIRNSIQHQDFIIDPKQPKITFYDRKKPPLSLTIEEYAKVFWESYFLTMSFDIGEFDLKNGILDVLFEETSLVEEYLKKHGLKLKIREEGGLSILDLALLIKTGKIT
jgi:hypothetical protein